MELTPRLHEDLVWKLEAPADAESLLRDLSDRIATLLDEVEGDALYEALVERERTGSTATPERVAFPHAMVEGLDRTQVAVARVPEGVDFAAGKHRPADLVFVLVGPPGAGWEHLRLLARLARICQTPGALDRLRAADDAAALYQALVEEDHLHD